MADAAPVPAPPGVPGHTVTDRQLRWGLWFVIHRPLFRRIGHGILIAIAAVSWGYTLWGFADYFFVSGARFNRELSTLASRANPRAAIIDRQRPKPITIADVLLIPTGGSAYDAAVRLVNPNPRWLVTADVSLDIPGAEAAPERVTLLPGGERWVVRANVTSRAQPGQATATLRGFDWRRMTAASVPDVERYIRERFAVDVRNATFAATPPARGSTGATIGRAAFTVVNAGAYGLRTLDLIVLLERSGAIVGVNRTVIEDLAAGESRSVAATWFQSVGLVTAVRVLPYADVFDPHAFLPPTASAPAAPSIAPTAP